MTVISGQIKNSYDPDVIIAIWMQPFETHYLKQTNKQKTNKQDKKANTSKEQRNKQKRATTKYYNFMKT